MCLCENESIMCCATVYTCLKKFKKKKHIKDVKRMVCSPEGFCSVSAFVKYSLKKEEKKGKKRKKIKKRKRKSHPGNLMPLPDLYREKRFSEVLYSPSQHMFLRSF